MAQASAVSRAPRPSSLADVLDLILDKGLVIDAYVRVSAVGIEILTIDARIVVASVDTYLRFAEAVNRLDLRQTETAGMPELMRDWRSGGDDQEGGNGDGARRSVSGGQRTLGAGRPGGGGDGGQRRPQHARPARAGEDREGEPAGLIDRLTERGRWST